MFWNFAPKSLAHELRQKQSCTCSMFLQSAEALCLLLTKQWKESQALPSLHLYVQYMHLFFHDALSGETMRITTLHHHQR